MEKIIKLEELDIELNEAYEELAESGWENHEIRLQKLSDGNYLFTCNGSGININKEKALFHK